MLYVLEVVTVPIGFLNPGVAVRFMLTHPVKHE